MDNDEVAIVPCREGRVMGTISNTTMTRCQHCHEWTNYADDAHHKAREAQIAELEELLRHTVARAVEGPSGPPAERGEV